jgi:hypothetical protein
LAVKRLSCNAADIISRLWVSANSREREKRAVYLSYLANVVPRFIGAGNQTISSDYDLIRGSIVTAIKNMISVTVWRNLLCLKPLKVSHSAVTSKALLRMADSIPGAWIGIRIAGLLLLL